MKEKMKMPVALLVLVFSICLHTTISFAVATCSVTCSDGTSCDVTSSTGTVVCSCMGSDNGGPANCGSVEGISLGGGGIQGLINLSNNAGTLPKNSQINNNK